MTNAWQYSLTWRAFGIASTIQTSISNVPNANRLVGCAITMDAVATAVNGGAGCYISRMSNPILGSGTTSAPSDYFASQIHWVAAGTTSAKNIWIPCNFVLPVGLPIYFVFYADPSVTIWGNATAYFAF